MIRRNARQRRDYLHRRALTLRAAETATKRAALRASLASGTPLTPALARDRDLQQRHKYDDSQRSPSPSAGPDPDDEYGQLSGVVAPRILLTTSRAPSSRLAAFAKELRLLLPGAVRLNRGGLELRALVAAAAAAGLTDVALLHEHRGTPTALTVSHLPHGPTAAFSLHGVALRHDLEGAVRGTVSEAAPHLVFEGFGTPLGKRVVRILQHLFPAAGEGSAKRRAGGQGRTVAFVNRGDAIEMRHHVFVRTGREAVELAEVGPRMTMRLFEIRGGTLENKDGDVEWQLNQYTRTAAKKDHL